jgi:hypothetical protein
VPHHKGVMTVEATLHATNFSMSLSHYFRSSIAQVSASFDGWLRHCATSRKVAGSIPDSVIGIFHSLHPSGRTMTLMSTQPGGKGGRCVRLTALPPSCADCIAILGVSTYCTLIGLLHTVLRYGCIYDIIFTKRLLKCSIKYE